MISTVLMPGWPRPLWGSFYESAVSAPLARSMLDLLLPKSLGFAVTPKGITSQENRFDWRSTKWTLLLAAVTAFAIAKGLFELAEFGVEQDAYFFNLAWAGLNLFFLLGGLMIAWERPQRREEERVSRAFPVRLHVDAASAPGGRPIEAWTTDVGIGGCAVLLDAPIDLPPRFDFDLGLEKPIRLRARVAYQERVAGRTRLGLAFVDRGEAENHALLLGVFADPKTWEAPHRRQARRYPMAVASFVLALAGYLRPSRRTRRRHPRRRTFARARWRLAGSERHAWLRDRTPYGLGLVVGGDPPRADGLWRVIGADGAARIGRTVHFRRHAFVFWRVGIVFAAELEDSGKVVDELAIS